MSRLEIFTLVVAGAGVLFMLELVRRRQLREKYALLWSAVGLLFLATAVLRRQVDAIADLVGVDYGPTVLFLVAILFLTAIAAHLSWEISRLEERTRRLAEEVAILRSADRGPRESTSPRSGLENSEDVGGTLAEDQP